VRLVIADELAEGGALAAVGFAGCGLDGGRVSLLMACSMIFTLALAPMRVARLLPFF